MATLRNKRKLAAVSRETPKGSRSSRGQNVLDPELTQDYISQVSEEIEGRVTKKLSKEFSKTDSRILGALSKLDEFLLNPQVRTCSVAVPGTSRNANSENRETHGDHSSDDPYPEVGFFPHPSGQLNSPETETNPQVMFKIYPHSPLIVLIYLPDTWGHCRKKLDNKNFPFTLLLYLYSYMYMKCMDKYSIYLLDFMCWKVNVKSFLIFSCSFYNHPGVEYTNKMYLGDQAHK